MMKNYNCHNKIDRMGQFEQVSVKIKEMIQSSARNTGHLRKMDLKTIKNLHFLNGKSDELVAKVNRLQQYFKLIDTISQKELNHSQNKEHPSAFYTNSQVRINRLAVNADKAIADLQIDIIEFAQSYKKLDKNKYMVPEIIGIMREFIDNIFYIFDDLTDEAEEVLGRISSFNKQINHPAKVIFNFNKN